VQSFVQDFNPLYLVTVPDAILDIIQSPNLIGTSDFCEHAGEFKMQSCCKCDYERQVHAVSCGRPGCPSCWPTWATRAAQRMAARTWGYWQTKATVHHPRHVTFDLTCINVVEAKRRLLSLGATGGSFVIHPWRIKREYQDEASRFSCETGENRYEWVRKQPDPMAVLDYSPHCHALCYGRLKEIKAGSKVYEYKVIRPLNSLEAVEGVAFYLLSHTAMPAKPGGHCYHYFGVCRKDLLKPTYTGEESRPVFCPVCGAALVDKANGEPVWVRHYVTEGWFIVKPVLPPPRVLKVSPSTRKLLDLPPGLAT